MATHSSILAWEIPWTEADQLQSMGSQKVRHDLTHRGNLKQLMKHVILYAINDCNSIILDMGRCSKREFFSWTKKD